MRDATFAVIMVLTVIALALCLVEMASGMQGRDGQLHNPYWPFSVEVQMRDR